MTPVRLGLVAPIRISSMPLRPIIRAASAARRPPVTLLWRRRRPIFSGSLSRQARNRRVDHFHHWSARLQLDWRVGIVTPVTTPLMSAPAPARFRIVPSASPVMRPEVQHVRTRDRRDYAASPVRFLPRVALVCQPPGARAVSAPVSTIPASGPVRRSIVKHIESTELRAVHHWRTLSRHTVSPDHAPVATPRRSLPAPAVMRQSRQAPTVRWFDTPAAAPFARRPVIRLSAPAVWPADAVPAVSVQRRAARPPVTLVWRPKDGATDARHATASAPVHSAATHAVPAITQSSFELPATTTVVRSNAIISSASPMATPDIIRLVDEVMRRIDRQTRSERQRRGL